MDDDDTLTLSLIVRFWPRPLPVTAARTLGWFESVTVIHHGQPCGRARVAGETLTGKGSHVLTAEDIILMAWAAPEPARARLSAFASGIWSRLPSVAPSDHLTALLNLDHSYSQNQSQNQTADHDPRVGLRLLSCSLPNLSPLSQNAVQRLSRRWQLMYSWPSQAEESPQMSEAHRRSCDACCLGASTHVRCPLWRMAAVPPDHQSSIR